MKCKEYTLGREFRRVVLNKKKGRKVKLRKPKDVPKEVWEREIDTCKIEEELCVEYLSTNSGDIWEACLQLIKCAKHEGLRVATYRNNKFIRVPEILWEYVIDDLAKEINKTPKIKDYLNKLLRT